MLGSFPFLCFSRAARGLSALAVALILARGFGELGGRNGKLEDELRRDLCSKASGLGVLRIQPRLFGCEYVLLLLEALLSVSDGALSEENEVPVTSLKVCFPLICTGGLCDCSGTEDSETAACLSTVEQSVPVWGKTEGLMTS